MQVKCKCGYRGCSQSVGLDSGVANGMIDVVVTLPVNSDLLAMLRGMIGGTFERRVTLSKSDLMELVSSVGVVPSSFSQE